MLSPLFCYSAASLISRSIFLPLYLNVLLKESDALAFFYIAHKFVAIFFLFCFTSIKFSFHLRDSSNLVSVNIVLKFTVLRHFFPFAFYFNLFLCSFHLSFGFHSILFIYFLFFSSRIPFHILHLLVFILIFFSTPRINVLFLLVMIIRP